MKSEFELWQFIADRLGRGESIMLLVVAKSSGSSPGRVGYKMAVAADGELAGSIGGGVMEVNLVEQSRAFLSERGAIATGPSLPMLIEQVHRRDSPNSSGMICSGRQTVIFRKLGHEDLATVDDILSAKGNSQLVLNTSTFELRQAAVRSDPFSFELLPGNDFRYVERVETRNRLFIIGGGHCALALSQVMSRLGFRISIFDDRPELNTIEKNSFADSIEIIESYERIGEFILPGDDSYVVVMTLGYRWDEVVIRALFNRDFKYFGVLGSKAKMAALFRNLANDGFDKERIARIRAPIGLPINSRTPEEIAVSIAAEIISIRNS